MKTHSLKTWPEFFQATKRGEKLFEVRINDRNYEVGDRIILHEYDPKTDTVTGEQLNCRITYILPPYNDVVELGDNCILSLKLLGS